MVGMPGKLRHLITAAAVLVGIAGCSGTGNVDTSVSGGGTQIGTGNIAVYQVAERKMVDNVSGTTLQGKPLSLASYRGKVLVVDFWSDACGPCHGEEAALEQLSTQDASKGVQFVGIEERDNLSQGQAFEAQYGVTYPSLFDREDAYVLDFPGAPPVSTPSTIILDPTGHIAARVDGPQDYSHFSALIDQIRSESA
jgi:peroxiredoxin